MMNVKFSISIFFSTFTTGIIIIIYNMLPFKKPFFIRRPIAQFSIFR